MFCKIKFVNSADIFKKAFLKVIKFEKVPPRNALIFQLTYESRFNKALNTKRSLCEQAGAKIAKEAIADFQKRREVFFIVEELCKLRRATMERERWAFFWFFDAFLECVCGARAWRKAKKELLVSEAKDDGNSIIVTKSDEAFGLLLIDYYLEKWRTTLASEEETTSVEPVDNSNTTEGEATGGQKRKKKQRNCREITPRKRKLEPASSVGGAVLEWHGSTNCTASLNKKCDKIP